MMPLALMKLWKPGSCSGLSSLLSVFYLLMELSSFTFASIPVFPSGKSVEVRSTVPPSKATPIPAGFNFLPLVNMRLGGHGPAAMAKLNAGDLAGNQDSIWNITSNDPDVEIQPQSTEETEWKTRVIIVCTVTAASELIFALFIIVYWKELRWSLRKITCPCYANSSNRPNHQRMTVFPSPFHRRRRSNTPSMDLDLHDVSAALFHQQQTQYSSSEEDISQQAGTSQGTPSHNLEHEVTYAVPSTSRGTSSSVVLHHHHLPPGRVVCVDSSDDDNDDDDDDGGEILRSVYVASNNR